MGTDIHLAVEARENGVWINKTPFKNDHGYLSNYPNGYYDDRNYNLFAILANVRNGYGSAGVITGSGFNPISSPRGVPEDADPQVREWALNGDHSKSYVTLKELLDYDWTQVTTKQGVIGSLSQLAKYKLEGAPDEWSGGSSGPGIETFELTTELLQDLDKWIEAYGKEHKESRFDWWSLYHAGDDEFSKEDFDPRVNSSTLKGLREFKAMLQAKFMCEKPHFLVSWQTPYYACAKSFLSETMPKLWRLGAPENVRLVFWFDS